MVALVSILDVSKHYGARSLFTKINFSIESDDRIGLIGPNGAGKSTLLKIIADQILPDDGTVARQRGLRLGYLEQIPVFKKEATILTTLLAASMHPKDDATLALAYALIAKLDLNGTVGNIDPETKVDQLSGGWKKRVALARELMKEPDLLLLDEPTNHLDVESILWLEDFLQRATFAWMMVTHDRYFLQKVVTRILELDKSNPNGLLNVQGHYQDYLYAKELQLLANQKLEQNLKNTFRREQEWLRSGTKARTTKQQARIERAYALEKSVETIVARNSKKEAGIEFIAEEHFPKKLLTAKHLTKSLGAKLLFKDLDVLLSPGSCVALLGPNGCGKSTLIQTLLKKIPSDAGEIFHSDQLKVAYFEQNRDSLNQDVSVAKALAPHGDQVIYRGQPVHVRGYLDRFLFTAMQMNMPVSQLSGGEQSRLLIARLMLQDANLLVLDEPTNDLDLATLAILEDCLLQFSGAVLLVTHDRFFLERVATEILAFHPAADGRIEKFVSLQQWQIWHEQELKKLNNKQETILAKKSLSKKKLGYLEQREYDGMEAKIHEAELALQQLTEQLQSSEIICDSKKLLELTQTMQQAQLTVDQLYQRWTELEAKQHS